MDNLRQWIIGSAPSSDVHIDSPTVSGRHCRMIRSQGAWSIEDLGSTNGTYVNGTRIHSPTLITPNTRVTLGSTVILPWPSVEASARSISIGRDSQNAYIVDAVNISSFHAQLIIGPLGTLVIEDLDSTNGTWLEQVGQDQTPMGPTSSERIRINRLALVEKDWVIYLGTTPLLIKDIVSGAVQNMVSSEALAAEQAVKQLRTQELTVAFRSVPQKKNAPLSHRPLSKGLLAAGGVVMAGLLLVGVLVLRRPDAAPKGSAEVSAQMASVAETNRQAPFVVSLELADETKKTASNADQASREIVSASPSHSLGWVILQGGSPRLAFRLGTAWCADKEVLMTTAGVVEAMQQLLNEDQNASEAIVVNGTTGKTHRVISSGTHPEFRKNLAALNGVSSTLENRLQSLKTPDEDSLETVNPDQDGEAIKKEILDLGKKQFDITQAVMCFDVGWLRVDPPFSSSPLAIAGEQSVRPKQKLRLLAAVFDIEDPYYDESTLFEPAYLDVRVGTLLNPLGISQRRMVASTTEMIDNKNLFGAPLIDERNKVVGMFVRSTQNSDQGNRNGLEPTHPVSQLDIVLTGPMTQLIEEFVP